jgi:hypothetical protein
MLEVEAKYLLREPQPLLERLQQWGATLLEDQQHVDTYLNAPDRDFARTDEALRLRQIGSDNFVTYKGPRYDTTTKTRPELEVSCGVGAENAAQFIRLFQHLGYKQVAQVRTGAFTNYNALVSRCIVAWTPLLTSATLWNWKSWPKKPTTKSHVICCFTLRVNGIWAHRKRGRISKCCWATP